MAWKGQRRRKEITRGVPVNMAVVDNSWLDGGEEAKDKQGGDPGWTSLFQITQSLSPYDTCPVSS